MLIIKSEINYFALDKNLAEQIEIVAKKRGISANTLVNLWIQEELQQQNVL